MVVAVIGWRSRLGPIEAVDILSSEIKVGNHTSGQFNDSLRDSGLVTTYYAQFVQILDVDMQ